MKITLTLSDKQAQVLVGALDLYSRVLIGQIENVEEVLRLNYPDLATARLGTARGLCDTIKMILWEFQSGASFGIHNPRVPDKARQAWDLQQVIRNTIARTKNPEGGIQVCYDTPTQTSTEEPLATATISL